ncbi:hypothetical protein KC336_g19472 [Hortaea werneckii]|nr:hypothetical protein KC336_g19472 [Hortaea werneckii]
MGPPTCCQRLKLTVQTWWFHFFLSRYLISSLAIVNCLLGFLHLPSKYMKLSLCTRAGYVLFTLIELRLCHDIVFALSEAMIHGIRPQNSHLDGCMLICLVLSDTAILGTDFFLLVKYEPYLAWTAKQWEDSSYASIRIISPKKMAVGFPWLYMSMILLPYTFHLNSNSQGEGELTQAADWWSCTPVEYAVTCFGAFGKPRGPQSGLQGDFGVIKGKRTMEKRKGC